MTILIGTILTQPQMYGSVLAFRIRAGDRVRTVIRTAPEHQKLDVLFLSIGQQVILCGRGEQDCIRAEWIRILDCTKRNYLLCTPENEENGVLLCGDSAVPGMNPGN